MSENDKGQQVTMRDGSETSVAFLFSVNNPHLTPDQLNHINSIGKEFCFEMMSKYVKGQKEHGGNLWDLPIDSLLNAAIEEAIDQVVYLLTLKRKLHENVSLPIPKFPSYK